MQTFYIMKLKIEKEIIKLFFPGSRVTGKFFLKIAELF